MSLSIKKGDTVQLILGGKSGEVSRGLVLEVNRKKGVALVEGVNMVSKHARARSQEEPGGIIRKEAPIRLCKLMLVDPKTGVASRFSSELDAEGNKIRRSKKTSNEV